MKRRSVISDRWDVVLVPFPFVERAGSKRRPALVLSTRAFNRVGHSVLAMITTTGRAPWPGDTPLHEHRAASLPSPCLVRMKTFTLDNRLILRVIGHLSETDAATVHGSLKRFLP
jgi:mRNA interferase MazF